MRQWSDNTVLFTSGQHSALPAWRCDACGRAPAPALADVRMNGRSERLCPTCTGASVLLARAMGGRARIVHVRIPECECVRT